MTRRNKQRGYELEKEAQDFWRDLGVECQRVLGSGAYKNYSADLAGDLRLNGLLVECKRRKDGFRELYKWLSQDDADLLIVRADRKHRIYVIPESLMVRFATDMGWRNEQGERDNA